MLPAARDVIRVRSTRVVLDGIATPATVSVEVGSRGPAVVAIDRGAGPADEDHSVVDVGDAAVVPAPLDLHFHGAGGHVVPPGGSVAAIDATLRAEAEAAAWRDSRVPAPAYEWIATLPIPSTPPADPLAELAAAARAITEARAAGTTACVGLRIEGLFLNPTRAGVWPPETFRPPSVRDLELLHEAAAAEGTPLLIVDIAPETGPRGAAEATIRRARELGIVISLAHTDADYDTARAAVDAGATLATHTWNAMRPTTHRDPGVVAAVLADPRVTCELICDGVHLHPGTIALSVAATGPGRWAVISDASPFAGCAPGPYDWAGTTVHHDGIALRDDAGRLAGSASLAWAARGVLAGAGVSDLDAALALGATPRRVLDPSRPLGLRVGDPLWVVPAR